MSRILVINNVVADNKNPKRGEYVNKIARAIEKAGFDVDMLVPRQSGHSALTKIVWYLVLYLDLLKHNYRQYDLIYINHFPFMALPLLLRMQAMSRVVIHWHGEDLLPPDARRARFFDGILKQIPGHWKHVTPSEYFRNQLIAKRPDAGVYVSPSGGIDISFFAQRPPPVSRDPIRIAFASGLDYGKGYDLLTQLLKGLPRLEQLAGARIVFHYIDYGPLKGTWRSLSALCPDSIQAEEMISPADMPRFYQANDILVFPTQRPAESLGLAPLEAMACGLPVIAPAQFACPEYVKSGVSGELFEPGNFDDFFDKIVSCIRKIEHYDPRSVVENHYSLEAVTQGYREVIEKILGANK